MGPLLSSILRASLLVPLVLLAACRSAEPAPEPFAAQGATAGQTDGADDPDVAPQQIGPEAPPEQGPPSPVQAEGWAPPGPPQDDPKDWIRLKSGEWLRGEILALYRHTLDFESDELDQLSLDFDDVREVRTNRPFTILRGDQTTITGTVNVLDDRVVIVNESGEYHTERSNVTRMVTGSVRERDHWTGKLSLGASIRAGNTEQLDTSANLFVRRRTAHSRLDFQFLGAYSLVEDVVTQDNERLNSTYDLFVGPRLFVTPLALELFRDPFQNIDLRVLPAAGVGYALTDTNSLEWDVFGGLGYRYTRFSSTGADEPDSESLANLLVGTSVESDLTKKLELTFDYSAQIGIENVRDTNQNATLVFSFDVWKDLDFDLTFVWNRVGLPAPDEDGNIPDQDDFRLSVGLGWEF